MCVPVIFTGADFNSKKSHRDILFNRMVNILSFFQSALSCIFAFFQKSMLISQFWSRILYVSQFKMNEFPANVYNKCSLSKFKC